MQRHLVEPVVAVVAVAVVVVVDLPEHKEPRQTAL